MDTPPAPVARRVAAIDCGTNSLRLLISEITPVDEGRKLRLHDVVRTMEVVRLGEGVDATGELSRAALARTERVLTTYAELLRVHGVGAVRMVATSATRDAANREDFFAMTRRVLGEVIPGAEAEVITGEEEAQLSLRGALIDVDTSSGPACVVDLGGGSTEVIVGTAEEILGAHSANMGCVRLTERFLHTDPPTGGEIAAAQAFINTKMASVSNAVPLEKARVFVGCAGTFTTLAALADGMEDYDSSRIHGMTVSFAAMRTVTDEMVAATREQRAAQPVMHPGRADVIGGGSLVVQALCDSLERVGLDEIVISEKDILDGIIWDLAVG